VLYLILLTVFQLATPAADMATADEPGRRIGRLGHWRFADKRGWQCGGHRCPGSVSIACIILLSDLSLAEIVDHVRREIDMFKDRQRQRELMRRPTSSRACRW